MLWRAIKMVSFLIHKPQPKLQDVFRSLELGNFKPKFQEIEGIEIITLTIANEALDVTISFNNQNHKISCLVVTLKNQSQFAYYEDFFHQAVTGTDLLGWWYFTCRDVNSRVLAARAIELAFA